MYGADHMQEIRMACPEDFQCSPDGISCFR